jgi:hypothetical protein
MGAAIRWALSYPTIINARLLLLGDSLAVLGALAKGRSSAFSLRALLRPIAAMLLSANVSLRLLYVPSAANPADFPSRHPRTLWRPDALGDDSL